MSAGELVLDSTPAGPTADPPTVALLHEELARAARHPCSQWTFCPLARCVAAWLVDSRVRPLHITVGNLGLTMLATLLLLVWPTAVWLTALLVALAWFCDRLDGILARRQGTVSAYGAWFDANIDELGDLLLQMAVAFAACRTLGATWPWNAWIGFVCGKYLFLYSLQPLGGATVADVPEQPGHTISDEQGWLRWLYHLPGNVDVRVHLLLVSLLLAYWMPVLLGLQVVVIALYYNVRWITRHALQYLRLRDAGGAP